MQLVLDIMACYVLRTLGTGLYMHCVMAARLPKMSVALQSISCCATYLTPQRTLHEQAVACSEQGRPLILSDACCPHRHVHSILMLPYAVTGEMSSSTQWWGHNSTVAVSPSVMRNAALCRLLLRVACSANPSGCILNRRLGIGCSSELAMRSSRCLVTPD